MGNSVQAIEVAKSQPLQVFGQDEQIAGLVRRLRFMMPGAADAPDLVVWKAAQIATMHHLDPFTGDIYIYPKGGVYIVDTGVAAWRRAAQRQAKYTTIKRPMKSEEVQGYLTGGYKPGDVGVECTLYRLDVAKECQSLGIPYEPVVTRGFFRDKDTIPNTETATSVAERRAEKKALRVAFSLDFPDDLPVDARHDYQLQEVARLVANEEQHRLPVAAKCTDAEMAEFLNPDDEPVTGNYEEVDFSAAKIPPPAAAPAVATAHYPESWSKPGHAQDWAVANGYCANEFEARGSWAKVVMNYGIFSRANAAEVYQAFFERQLTKSEASGK